MASEKTACRTVLLRLDGLLGRVGSRIDPFLFLAIRLWIGEVFFSAGLSKLRAFLNGQGEQLIETFGGLYELPVSAMFTAPLVMSVELLAGGLFILGLFSRYAAWALALETLVIQMVLPMPDLHLPWIMLLLVIAVRGPGSLSLDVRLNRS